MTFGLTLSIQLDITPVLHGFNKGLYCDFASDMARIGFVSIYEVRQVLDHLMADLPRYMRLCLQSGKLAFLAILVSGGIVLQILACALYNNWWPMLTVIMYVLLPMPLLFFVGSDFSVFMESDNAWVNVTKFLTGASAIGSIAIPAILTHAGVIGWGALALELSSFFVFVLAIMCYIRTDDGDSYIYAAAARRLATLRRIDASPVAIVCFRPQTKTPSRPLPTVQILISHSLSTSIAFAGLFEFWIFDFTKMGCKIIWVFGAGGVVEGAGPVGDVTELLGAGERGEGDVEGEVGGGSCGDGAIRWAPAVGVEALKGTPLTSKEGEGGEGGEGGESDLEMA
ncbi:hypothetical protein ACLB2K_047795 [Fragaria x ananassa]